MSPGQRVFTSALWTVKEDDPQLFFSIGPWDSVGSIEPHTLESVAKIDSAIGSDAA